MKKHIFPKVILFALVALFAAACGKSPQAPTSSSPGIGAIQSAPSPAPVAPSPAPSMAPTPPPGSGSAPKPAPAAGMKTFTVSGQNFSFTPSELKVKKGDKVKITFQNSGGFHDFVLDAFNVRTKQIGSGQSDSVEFTADKTGTFEYYCSVGSHRQMGMKGNLIVQ